MSPLSVGARLTILVLLLFACLGSVLTATHYAQYHDPSDLLWVALCLLLIALTYFMDRNRNRK